MELTWTVRGAYANWTMTVSTAPPDPEEEVEYRDDWRTEPFTRVHGHFRDVVDLLEAARTVENVPGSRLSYT
jgi:hypothetical protein